MLNERDAGAVQGTAGSDDGSPRRLVLKASLATLAAVGTGAYSALAQAQVAPISDANTRWTSRASFPTRL